MASKTPLEMYSCRPPIQPNQWSLRLPHPPTCLAVLLLQVPLKTFQIETFQIKFCYVLYCLIAYIFGSLFTNWEAISVFHLTLTNRIQSFHKYLELVPFGSRAPRESQSFANDCHLHTVPPSCQSTVQCKPSSVDELTLTGLAAARALITETKTSENHGWRSSFLAKLHY
ncbi:hypothetical protein PanWU01x14_306670 [Parasponia andersonii]|uniref:Uncharacterized protein n=1 Tax=Parasponia andersonii TaxID=3476 RepID=A0A2P5ARR5_PARAD|nr:hypothetical protein PanWU01x14_306670 [Parasponia andersonii]